MTGVALGVRGTFGLILWIFLPPFPGASPAPSVISQLIPTLLDAIPLVVCALIVSLRDRLGALLRSAERRPAALLIPGAILLVVLAYHVSGLIIDG